MKQTKFIFVLATIVALCVSFSSCSKDDNSLVGTTWVWEDEEYDETVTIKFTTKTAGTLTEEWGSGADVTSFTYKFNDPTVSITLSDDGITVSISGTVRGSTMTLRAFGEESVFTKQ
ncbi:MAG: hypothetical protein LBI15_00450 [Dysgonamonadaceae bacterium]|nr:hypothetical protein [Dysgonamonadaceae bacterium]